jgi:hypothetical protein
MLIDTSFDFTTDAGGKDPDSYSLTLRRYHKTLWSKTLPNGELFNLDDKTAFAYLHHKSPLGEFFLSSDSVIPTYKSYTRMQKVISEVPEADIQQFYSLGYTIGGMMVFPSNKVSGQMTINGARGFNPAIADRMDLTLECIRRHYEGGRSPLADILAGYSDFFALFGDFDGYVDFFLLQDLLNNLGSVRFFMPFDDFTTRSLPQDVSTYMVYRQNSIEFINSRNERISNWVLRQT